LFFVYCGGPVCAPGATQICPCLSDDRQINGVQVCAEDGQSWKACRCPSTEPKDAGEPTSEPDSEPLSEPPLVDASEPYQEPPSVDEPGKQMDAGPPELRQEPTVERKPIPEPGPPELTPMQRLAIDLWPWGAKAVVSLTIDDGLKAPFEKLVPEIEKRGWRSTLFICTEMATTAGSWDLIKAAYKKGHEVTSHTHTHRNMASLTEAELRKEFETAIAELQKRIDWKLPLESFAYPYESANALAKKLVWDYHRYARGGDQGVDVPPNPVPLNDARRPDFQFLQAKAPTRKYTVTEWNRWVSEAVKQGKWFIEEYHGVDGKDWEPRTMAEFQSHFDHIESFGKQIWVAPVSAVGHYIDERQTAKFVILKWNPQEIVLQLKDNFTEKHNVPLSFTLLLPASWGWNKIKVVQNGIEQKAERIRPGFFRTQGLPEPTQSIRITPVN
jgi:peptidoglycan/xylan/chitin deacetylase (PgdA/CDA1 family)